jgi:hypothetical protein
VAALDIWYFLCTVNPLRDGLKGIDRIISQSDFSLLKLLCKTILCVLVLFISITILIHLLSGGTDVCARFWSTIGHFLEPGNFDNEERENWVFFYKIAALFINLVGMVLLGGVLITTLNNILEQRIEKVRNGQVYYHFKDHIVIIGYDKMCIGLIKQLAGKYPQCAIVLQTIQAVPEVRHELFSNLKSGVERDVTIISGNRASREDLEKLHLPNAKELFVLGENDEYDHDSLNMECLDIIATIVKDSCTSLKKCHILLEYQSTYAVFQQQQLNTKLFSSLDVIPFNFYEMWTRKVFVGGNYLAGKNYPALDRIAIDPESDKYVHLVVVGATRMGVATAIQAARLAHYANYRKQKTKITIIDIKATEQMHIMRSRYQAFFEAVNVYLDGKKEEWSGELDSYMPVEFNFLQNSIESSEIRKKLVEWSRDSQQILTVAICFNHPPASLAVGLYLPDEVYAARIPVLVRLETSGSMLHSFRSKGKYEQVYAFGMTSECYEWDISEDIMPQYVQYIYYNQLDFNEKPFPTRESLAKDWKTTSVVHKWSNRYNADTIPAKLRVADSSVCRYEDIKNISESAWEKYDQMETVLAEMEHNRWNVERLLAGYKYLNEERKKRLLDSLEDDELKQHIIHIKTLKDQYQEECIKWFDLWKNNKNKEADEQKKINDELWTNRIKPAKNAIEGMFYHDCIVPYKELSAHDQYSDIAITRGIKWIIRNRPKNSTDNNQ